MDNEDLVVKIVGVIIGICLFICISGCFIVLAGVIIQEEVEVIDGPCYDIYRNQIEELTCKHTIYDYKWLSWCFSSPEEQKEIILEDWEK